MRSLRSGPLVVWIGLLTLVGGCSRFPPPPERPRLDPDEASRQAMSEYDANGDGKIDAAELKKSPPLLEALDMTDADKDGAISVKELCDRMELWTSSPTIVETQSTTVTLDGRPLAEATVTYEPEKFMGQAFQPTSGVTDATGTVSIPGQDPKYPGLYLGVYRVRISKKVDGKETLPARYNTETELAKEVAPDSPSLQRLLKFDLKSR